MKYLLFDWNLVNLEISDLTEITDVEFENLAKKYGYIFDNAKDFESAFNAQILSTETFQLRII